MQTSGRHGSVSSGSKRLSVNSLEGLSKGRHPSLLGTAEAKRQPKPLPPAEQRRADLQNSVRREFEALDEVSATTTSVMTLLPKLTTSNAIQSIREQTKKSGSSRTPATTPGLTSPRRRPGSRAQTSMSMDSRHRRTPSPRGRSPSPKSSRSQSPTSPRSGTKTITNILNPPRKWTPFERACEKREAGLAVLTFLEKQGQELVSASTFSERHKKVAQRKFHQVEDEVVAKLQKFYSREDARETALVSNAHREHEERLKQWLTFIAIFQRLKILGQSVRERRAKNVLANLFKVRFLAYLARRKARFQRQQAIKERQDQMINRPNKQQLRKLPCMRPLTDATIGMLIETMEKQCFIPGEYIAHEGTIGAGCWFLHRGAVELIRKETKGHGSPRSRREASARSIETSSDAGTLSVAGNQVKSEEGTAHGENHLLTEEPHECTLQAVQETDLWFLSRKSFLETLEKVPTNQAEPVFRMLDERRERNMIVNRSFSEAFVRKSSFLFEKWTEAGLRRIVELVEPSIYRKGDTIVEAGQYGKTIVFIVRGRVTLTDGKRQEVFREGQAFGEVAAARSIKDRTTEVKAAVGCDCWVLHRTDFNELFCHESPMNFIPNLMLMVDESGKEKTKH